MICPHCANEIRLFTHEWQLQRSSQEKLCPRCFGRVTIVFSGKRFSLWLLGAAATISGACVAVGVPWPLALFLSLLFGCLVAMVPSMVLRGGTTPPTHG